jgi:hypothetical protein
LPDYIKILPCKSTVLFLSCKKQGDLAVFPKVLQSSNPLYESAPFRLPAFSGSRRCPATPLPQTDKTANKKNSRFDTGAAEDLPVLTPLQSVCSPTFAAGNYRVSRVPENLSPHTDKHYLKH